MVITFIFIKMYVVLSYTDACCICWNKIYMHFEFIFIKVRFENSIIFMFRCFRCFKLRGRISDKKL